MISAAEARTQAMDIADPQLEEDLAVIEAAVKKAVSRNEFGVAVHDLPFRNSILSALQADGYKAYYIGASRNSGGYYQIAW